jgi:hypothetical protein
MAKIHESIVSGPVFFPVIPGWPGNGARSATRRRKEEFMADNWRCWHAHPWSAAKGHAGVCLAENRFIGDLHRYWI